MSQARLDLAMFARIFDIPPNEVPEESRRLLETHDFDYDVIRGSRREEIMLSILQRLDSGAMSIAGKEKQDVWEKGWAENLSDYISSKGSLDELIPKYYRPNQPCRMCGEYVVGRDPYFEYNFFKVLRSYLFKTYASQAKVVYEFGCGPGHNLVALAERFPDMALFGFDWASSAVDLVNRISRDKDYKMRGIQFDMFNPNYSIEIEPERSLLITIGALEQTGNDFDPFLEFVLRKKPALCFNVEPLKELYQTESLFDYLAWKHHTIRNLLGDYLGRLRSLENSGRLSIKKAKKISFGGLMVDGWSFVVWQPL